ncbi:hypothetical protein HYPSUDRAFT_212239 [Hypholoma sublateritium FD-334 SS-4]|uniref:Uncharacterized protein n=1 Tax=Hypholoma sublateritium (strain FD-334 SS-4) TaxID=945553 RepID=A0A0D2P9N8_HYPSF|nr:hypothetical protein HYPSUDRAFT_212239 [Hypholoma sublateritium FD-334 SS-4]
MPSLPPDDDSLKRPLLSQGQPADSPPAYEYGAYTDADAPKPIAAQAPIVVQRAEAGSSTVPAYILQPSTTPPPAVYNYIHPVTGERVVSLLPPDHPEMVCLQTGSHIPESHFGILGILAAIFWFPLGVACCLLDRHVRCRRCGAIIDNGICD